MEHRIRTYGVAAARWPVLALFGLAVVASVFGPTPAGAQPRSSFVCPCFSKKEIQQTCYNYYQKTERRGRHRDYYSERIHYSEKYSKGYRTRRVTIIACGIKDNKATAKSEQEGARFYSERSGSTWRPGFPAGDYPSNECEKTEGVVTRSERMPAKIEKNIGLWKMIKNRIHGFRSEDCEKILNTVAPTIKR